MILGLDYASIDADHQPDFKALFAQGFRFVSLRRSFYQWDTSHQAWHIATDPTYARDAQAARDAGLVVGAYMMPAYHASAPSAVEQVSVFVKAAGEIIKGQDLPPCIDLEFPGKNGQPDTKRTQADTLKFFQEIVAEMRGAYGVAPLIYTSHVVWHDDNGLGGPQWQTDCPVWIKVPYRLRAGNAPDTVPPATPVLPLPWQRAGWWLRQFQGDARLPFAHAADGSPIIGQADLDDFHLFDPHTAQLSSDPAESVGRYDWVAQRVGWGTTCPTPDALSDTIKSFQTLHGLEPDGVVGPKTFTALYWQKIS